MNLRGASAMILVLVLLVCSAGSAGCTVRCAAGALATSQDSCHSGAMPGMMTEGQVSIGALPAGCTGHTVAVIEGIATPHLDVSLPVIGQVEHFLMVDGWLSPSMVVAGVGSSGRLRIPLRV